MFLEFCDGGALDSILVDLQKGLTEAQIAYVTHQICVGLGHLHRCAIIHRDLKAGQLLMFERHPSERSELRYGVRGLGFGVVSPLSPPRGLHWGGYKTSHMVKVSALHVLG